MSDIMRATEFVEKVATIKDGESFVYYEGELAYDVMEIGKELEDGEENKLQELANIVLLWGTDRRRMTRDVEGDEHIPYGLCVGWLTQEYIGLGRCKYIFTKRYAQRKTPTHMPAIGTPEHAAYYARR